MRPEEIGAIRSYSGSLLAVPHRYSNLFFNSPLIETILDFKPFTHFLGRFYNLAFHESFPAGIPYGLGLNSRNDLLEFLDSLESEFIVRKRGNSYCGTGVEVLERKPLIESLQSMPSHIDSARMQDMVYFILNYVINNIQNGNPFEGYVSMYQEFVPSIPIFNPHTGKYHDGCARTMVYSPPNGEPIVLGSQWRLAPHNIDDTCSLEDKFRANLSRGAKEMKIAPEHETVINNFANRVVVEFEKALDAYQNVLIKTKSYRGLISGNPLSDIGIFRLSFWSEHFKQRLKEYGALDGGKIIFKNV